MRRFAELLIRHTLAFPPPWARGPELRCPAGDVTGPDRHHVRHDQQQPDSGQAATRHAVPVPLPGPDSSTAQLRAYATVWAVLLPVWVSAQWWSHPDTLRRVLYVVLSLVSVTQSLSAVALLRRRR